MIFKRILAALAVSAAAILPQTAMAAFEKKVALIVGNGAYQNAPTLANPVTDAKAVASAFERLGFETVTGYDLDGDGMRQTVTKFAKASRKADITVFFYAGHGIAFEGTNYMVPVDAAFEDPTALDFEAVAVDFVTKYMRYADGVSLVFLDACRDNPLASTLTRSLGLSTRSAVSRGLAQMDVSGAGQGLAIAFATSPGEVAYDGAGTHSPFTSALLNHIEARDADITEVMSRVTGDVLRSTDEKQRPWLNASLTGPVVLNPAPLVPAAPEVQVAALSTAQQTGVPTTAAPVAALPSAARSGATSNIDAQKMLFDVARESNKVADYRAYLSTFPHGLFAQNAKAAIQELEAKTALPTTVAAVGGAATGAAAALPVPEIPLDKTPTTEATEVAMGMNRTQRREVQTRLNVAGHKVGGADGMFGPRTRAGIVAWQTTRGLPPTGFLSAAQFSALSVQTETAYQAELARYATRSVSTKRTSTKRRASTKRRSTKKRYTKRRTTTRRRTTKRSSGGCGPGCAAFIGGVAGGVVGGLLSR